MEEYRHVPREMKNTPNWLCYKLVDKGNGKFGKPPVSPKTGYPCPKNDRSKFVDFDTAVAAAKRLGLDGIGFVLADGWVAIDLDGCIVDGQMNDLATEVCSLFDGTFIERSPSGTGIHVFVRGEKTTTRSRDVKLGIECYEGFNFMTVTGDSIDPPEFDEAYDLDRQTDLDEFCARYLSDEKRNEPQPSLATASVDAIVDSRTPEEWLERGLAADGVFKSLWEGERPNGDESGDDFALAGKLAYWLSGDRQAIQDAFLRSPHTASKGDKHKVKVMERKDYLERTVERVVDALKSTAKMDDESYIAECARKIDIHFENHEHTLEDLTDIGNANLMAEVFGDRLRHTTAWGWCFWNGHVWELDRGWRALEAAKEVADTILGRANEEMTRVERELADANVFGEDRKRDPRFKVATLFQKHANITRNVNRIKAMVEIGTATMHSEAEEFDSDPWCVNTPGGIVDLRTCEVTPHNPDARMTATTALTPDFDSPAPMFEAFLEKISSASGERRQEWIDYLQRLVGSSMIGKVYTENLVMATGRGANGKSTLFNAVRYLIGDYGTSVDTNLLMSRSASEQQVGISMVHRKRLAMAQETEEGQRLSASMLKKLCSTDPKVGKRLYRDPIEFIPTHTLILSTNHLPKVTSSDEGTWRRIAVLPFDAVIPEDQRITDYHTKLVEAEGPQILAWMCKGAKAFMDVGCALVTPEVVACASQEYRSKEDWLANFLNECCVETDTTEIGVKHSDLYSTYVNWAADNGEYRRSSREFAKLVEAHGFDAIDKKRVGKWVGKVWFGLRLTDDHVHDLNAPRQMRVGDRG